MAKASEPIGYNLYEVLLLIFTLVLTNGCRDSYSWMVGNPETGDKTSFEDTSPLKSAGVNRSQKHRDNELHGTRRPEVENGRSRLVQ